MTEEKVKDWTEEKLGRWSCLYDKREASALTKKEDEELEELTEEFWDETKAENNRIHEQNMRTIADIITQEAQERL